MGESQLSHFLGGRRKHTHTHTHTLSFFLLKSQRGIQVSNTTCYLGNLAELMTDWERAMGLYECALRHNPYSINALSSIASLCRAREQFGKVRYPFAYGENDILHVP